VNCTNSKVVQALRGLDDSFEAVAMADGDVVANENWLRKLISPLALDPSVGGQNVSKNGCRHGSICRTEKRPVETVSERSWAKSIRSLFKRASSTGLMRWYPNTINLMDSESWPLTERQCGILSTPRRR
jgi:hypothetical protein